MDTSKLPSMTSMLPPSIGAVVGAATDTLDKAASEALPALTVSPDGVQQKPTEAHAEAAIDQAEASVASAVVSGTAAEKIAAKSAELVCAELRKNAGAIWQQAANAIIDHLDTPEVMGKFSNSISEAAIKFMPKSLTEAIVSDSKVAATIMVDVIDSIGKLNVSKYQSEIKQYTRGESVNALSAGVNQKNAQPQIAEATEMPPPPVPSDGVSPSAEPINKGGFSVQATATPPTATPPTATPIKTDGGKKTRRYKGGAIYSFQSELQFLKTMVRKSIKLNPTLRSIKKNKRKSKRLRK